jgi:hypothetical protein
MIQGALVAAGVAFALVGMRQVFGSDAADSAARSRRIVGELRPVAFGTSSVNVTELHRRGWIECDGQALRQSDFPELYGALSNTWGKAKDGDFRLPDLRHALLKGVSTDRQERQKELLGADYLVGRPSAEVAKGRSDRADVTYFIYAGREVGSANTQG